MAQKKTRSARKLLIGYLERISSKVFSDFPKELTALVGAEHGVYALYKGNRLYYIGLAGNLRKRIKQHLKDKHAGKWNAFSLYLVRRADHLRELESVMQRIADPKGNKAAGRLRHAQNLKSELEGRIKAEQKRQRARILGGGPAPPARVSDTKAKPKKGRKPSRARKAALAPYVTQRFKVRAVHKGKRYEASVRRDGTINYNGAIYTSPSAAGRAALGRGVNGWRFWRFRNEDGEWVRLDELRKKA